MRFSFDLFGMCVLGEEKIAWGVEKDF